VIVVYRREYRHGPQTNIIQPASIFPDDNEAGKTHRNQTYRSTFKKLLQNFKIIYLMEVSSD